MMEMRVNKRNGNNISLLGFGLMRLPKPDPDKPDIDKELAMRMVDYAYQNGVNYFDTAYPYHEGLSEVFAGEALARYPRDSFYLATKMPSWLLETKDDAPKYFAEQQKRLGTDYFDYYMLHAIGSSYEEFEKRYLQTGALEYLEGLKRDGTIRNLGFSFHGPTEVFDRLMEVREWDFVQVQLNYLDWDAQNAKHLYNALEDKGIPCIVMEPVRGGNLVSLCEESQTILKAAEPDASVASWAIRFAATLTNVMTVLSGMSDLAQVEDNVKTMSAFKPLDSAGLATLQEALQAYLNKGTIPCTGCRYCMDCPSGVDIPGVFNLYNKLAAERQLPVSFAADEAAFRKGSRFFVEAYGTLPEPNRAAKCVDCKVCEEHCPQSIKIPQRLKDIAGMAAALGL